MRKQGGQQDRQREAKGQPRTLIESVASTHPTGSPPHYLDLSLKYRKLRHDNQQLCSVNQTVEAEGEVERCWTKTQTNSTHEPACPTAVLQSAPLYTEGRPAGQAHTASSDEDSLASLYSSSE